MPLMGKHARTIGSFTLADPDSVLPVLARQGKPGRRPRWQAGVVIGLITLVALGLAAYAAAASYESVSGLAAAHHVPLSRLNPLGIDGGLFGVIAVDITLTWMGAPLRWLRLVARLFAIGTIAANAAAGWPDPAGVGLRIAAPALFVILVETGRAVLLRRQDEAEQEGIPASRWLLDFRGTLRLWRRMKLWRIRAYSAAVDMELSRLEAIGKLTDRYGKDWQKSAPGTLAWMLKRGVRMEQALRQVAELTAPPEREPAVTDSPVTPATPAKRPRVTKASSPRSKVTANRTREVHVPADVDTQLAALEILAAEPGISGRQLGARLGVDPSYGCRLKKRLTQAAPATGEQPRVS